MPQKKHPIFRLHKIKIHPNRWLIWAIAYAIIVTIAVVGYIKVSEVNFESQVAENQYSPWHNYKDNKLGFGIRYPAEWAMETTDNSVISFTPTKSPDEGVSVAVLKPSAENAIRGNLKISEESRITLDGNRAVRIVNDLGNNYFETIVMAIRGQRLYVLRGTDALMQELLLTFYFESGSENSIKN